MNKSSFLLSVLALSTIMTACVSTVSDFQSAPSGVLVQLTPQLGSTFLASRGANIYIAEEISACGYETLGVVRDNDLPKAIKLKPGKRYSLRTVFTLKNPHMDGTIVTDHVIVPDAGARYELIASYNKNGHGVQLLKNGKPMPYERPCLTNTN